MPVRSPFGLRPPSIDWSTGVARAKFEYLERDEAVRADIVGQSDHTCDHCMAPTVPPELTGAL